MVQGLILVPLRQRFIINGHIETLQGFLTGGNADMDERVIDIQNGQAGLPTGTQNELGCIHCLDWHQFWPLKMIDS